MGKVLCVIDHFGSGGAQRQMVELACGLRRCGHDVHAFIYFPELVFFRSRLDVAGVCIHGAPKGRGFSPRVLIALARLLRTGGFDGVVSFLQRPNVYSVLAHLLTGNGSRLVVSERSDRRSDGPALTAWIKRRLNRHADVVVANSETHAAWLRTVMPPTKPVLCIYNGFDLGLFHNEPSVPAQARDLRLLAIGRVGPEKNTLAVVQALAAFHRRHGFVPRLSWAGRMDDSAQGRGYVLRVRQALEAEPAVAQCWTWLGERDDIAELLRQHHALVHASFYEGLPNAVCEALCSGRPVLASRVCDHPRLIGDDERGILFDPERHDSLLAALEALCNAPPARWQAMRESCIEFAATELASERMVRAFEAALGLVPAMPDRSHREQPAS